MRSLTVKRSLPLTFGICVAFVFAFFSLFMFLDQWMTDLLEHLQVIEENVGKVNSIVKTLRFGEKDEVETHRQGAPRWLSILIPTVPRKDDPDYLIKTLEILETQLEGFGSRVEVLTWNSNVGGFGDNNIFQRAGKRWEDDPRFVFAQNPGPGVVFSKAELARGNANKPGVIVQKQARDVAGLLRYAAGRSDFALLIEDDWRLCDDALLLLEYAILKALRRDKDFISLVVSHGMNGIVFRNRDLEYFSGYLIKHQKRRPCDHLVIEWMCGETDESSRYKGNRSHFTFRYNLLEHFGRVSAVGHKWGDSPRCFEKLEMLFKVQAFDSKSCPKDDLWPCTGHSSIGFFSVGAKT